MNSVVSSVPMTVRTLAVALGIIVVLRLALLGTYALLDPTEGRYAEISREMVESGDWVVPRLEGETPFWGKPPLMFWMKALTYKVLGFNEFAARLPSFLLALLSGWLAFLFARKMGGVRFALCSSLILSTTLLYFVYAGYVATDPALLGTITLSMVAFLFALESTSRRDSLVWGGIFFVGLGGSVLAKGLVGLIFILTPIALWTLYYRRLAQVGRQLPWVWGIPLFLAISVPWHILCEIQTPGFLEYYFVGEHFKRFLVSDWEGDLYGSPHQFPRGFIWLFALLTAFPWSFILVVSLVRSKGRIRAIRETLSQPWAVYLFLWFFIPLGFFTLSRNVMFTYVLPTLPPFSILCALGLEKLASHEAKVPFWLTSRRAFFALMALVPLGFLFTVVAVIPSLSETRSQKNLALRFEDLDADRDAQLVYTDSMPPSGDFYTSGRALEIPSEDMAIMLEELLDDDQDYFAIKDNDLDNFPVEGFKLTTEVGRFGRYILRREFDALDLPGQEPLQLHLPEPEISLP